MLNGVAHRAGRFSATFGKVDPVHHDRKLYQVHVTGAGARRFKVSIPASTNAIPQPSPTSKIEQWFMIHRSLKTEQSCETFLTSRSSEITSYPARVVPRPTELEMAIVQGLTRFLS